MTKLEHLSVGYIRGDIQKILEKYMFEYNDSATHRLIQSDIETYLTREVANNYINEFVHSIDYGDSPNGLLVGVAIQPQVNDAFIYSNIVVTVCGRNIEDEDEVVSAKANAIALDIDKEILDGIITSASPGTVIGGSGIVGYDPYSVTEDFIFPYPSDRRGSQVETLVSYPHGGTSVDIDDLADIFEVINENNEEYIKTQNDDAYKRAMGIL